MDLQKNEAAKEVYVVVKFLDDESVSEVPRSWVIEESGVQTQCHWPSHASNVSNLIAKYAKPTPRWDKFNVDIIKDNCSSQQSARSAAADSDYNTTDNENLGKRKRTPVSILPNSTDDESIVPLKKRLKHVSMKVPGKKLSQSKSPLCPNFFTPKQTSTSSAVQQVVEDGPFDLAHPSYSGSFGVGEVEEPSVSEQGGGSSISGNTGVDNANEFNLTDFPNGVTMTSSSEANDLDKDVIEENNTWQSDLNLVSAMPVVIAEYDGDVQEGILVDKNLKSNLSIRQDVILDRFFDPDDVGKVSGNIALKPATKSTSPIVTQGSNVASGNTSQRYDLLPEPRATNEYLARILHFQANMSINIRSIDSRLKALESKQQNESKDKYDTDVTRELLPLKTTKDVKNFEVLVTKSKDAALAFKRRVERKGGNSPRDFVQRALTLTFTNSCAIDCSWKGYKNLFGVFKLEVTKIMMNAVFEKYAEYTEADFGTVATEWFSFAGQRRRREVRASSA